VIIFEDTLKYSKVYDIDIMKLPSWEICVTQGPWRQ